MFKWELSFPSSVFIWGCLELSPSLSYVFSFIPLCAYSLDTQQVVREYTNSKLQDKVEIQLESQFHFFKLSNGF